ncbi:MAG: ABC transporter permease [Alphaproteobacteria bacterium]|nr:ABC transporter permease [Alphaproteobacteria bacterium]
MILPQPSINHKIVQIAYVVNDVHEAAERWVRTFGVGPFFILDRPQVGDPMHRGKPQKVEFSAALAQAGDVHIELIEQHCDSPSCYRDLIPKGQEGFHHVAVIVEDYKSEVARYEGMGFPVAASGMFGPLSFCYVDASPVMMGMIEILEDLPFIHNYFARVREAAEAWDGSNPIRDANDLAG